MTPYVQLRSEPLIASGNQAPAHIVVKTTMCWQRIF